MIDKYILGFSVRCSRTEKEVKSRPELFNKVLEIFNICDSFKSWISHSVPNVCISEISKNTQLISLTLFIEAISKLHQIH